MRKETEILPDDVINIAFKEALDNGWKKWGKFYKKEGSSYQCFRRGSEYLWVGFAFIERGYSSFHYKHYLEKGNTIKSHKIFI